jgi:hypothetical protein
MFTILKYRESKKYVRLFRSEQEFGVSWEICEHRVDLLNKLLLLWCCVTCTQTELPQEPAQGPNSINATQPYNPCNVLNLPRRNWRRRTADRTFLPKTEKLVIFFLSWDASNEYQNIVNSVGWYRDPDVLYGICCLDLHRSSALTQGTDCRKSGLTNKKWHH